MEMKCKDSDEEGKFDVGGLGRDAWAFIVPAAYGRNGKLHPITLRSPPNDGSSDILGPKTITRVGKMQTGYLKSNSIVHLRFR
jgi:hypothetical protein